jgi:GNAT superfamily N-acetyltransferase
MVGQRVRDRKLTAMDAITVSVAGPEDIEALVSSVDGLFQEDAGRHDATMDLRWPTREGHSYYAGLVADPGTRLLLARAGELIAGHLVGKLREPDSLSRVRLAILESMRVTPELRGRGVGTALVREFFSWARQRGAELAAVSAYAGNEAAQRFYARQGFAPHTVSLRTTL